MAQNTDYTAIEHRDTIRQGVSGRAYRATFRNILIPLLFLWFAFICAETYSIFTTQQSFSLIIFHYLAQGLPTNFDLLLLLLMFLFSATGPGHLILRVLKLSWRDRWERMLFALATGLIFYTFFFLAVGSFGFLHLWVCYLAFGTGLTMAGIYTLSPLLRRWRFLRRRRSGTTPTGHRMPWTVVGQIWLTLFLLLFLYTALLGALSPETEFDARWYHLGPARAYAREDDFINYVQETNMRAAGLDVYQVVLYTVLWKFDGMIAAKMLHWGYALLTGLGIIYFCKSLLKSSLTGILGAVIYTSTPLISWSAGTGGNDLQLCFFTLLSVYAFIRWQERRQELHWLLLAGLMSGYALGSKWNGLLSVLIISGAIVFFTGIRFLKKGARRIPSRDVINPLLCYGVGVLIACLPWVSRLYYMTGNPLFPYFNSVFQSPYAMNGALSDATGQRLAAGPFLVTILNTITLQSQYRALLGPIFIFMLPICVISLFFCVIRERIIVQLLSIFIGVWLLLWYAISNLEIRYAEAIVPFLAILSAYGAVGARWHHWRGRFTQSALLLMLALLIASNFYPLVPFQKGAGVANAFAQPRIAWAYLYEGAPEGSVQLQYIPMIEFINTHLSSEQDKVYDTSGLILYASYSDVLFYSGTKSIDGSTSWDLLTPDAVMHLAKVGATYVSMTSATMEQIKQRPISRCLNPIYQTPDDQFLFKVEYTRVTDGSTSTCR